MLARIQSLYLFLVALLAVTSMFFPFWSFTAGSSFLLINDLQPPAIADTLVTITTFTGKLFSPLTALVAVVAIFLYKNRVLQTRLIMLAVLLFLGDLFSGLTAAHFVNHSFGSTGTVVIHHPESGFFLLLPEPILLWLAFLGVKKDDKIANAYKRL